MCQGKGQQNPRTARGEALAELEIKLRSPESPSDPNRLKLPPISPLFILTPTNPFSSSRFCVGDKFFLKNNMILCQMDYEEGQLNGSFESQVQ